MKATSQLWDKNANETQLLSHWEMIIPGRSKDFTMTIRKTDMPEHSSSVEQIRVGNIVKKFASNYDGEGKNITITVLDVIGTDAEKVLWDWRNQVVNLETNTIGKKSDYALDIQIVQYSRDFKTERSWVLKNAWPSSLTQDSLDADSASERKTMQVTLEFDTFTRKDKVAE